MIRVVYDCNVILSGIGWSGSARVSEIFLSQCQCG
jgi:hypothetical protein